VSNFLKDSNFIMKRDVVFRKGKYSLNGVSDAAGRVQMGTGLELLWEPGALPIKKK